MNILFLSRLFYPHVGGVEKHVLEISRLLTKKGCKVIILTERYDNNLKGFEQFRGIDIYRINTGKDNFLKKFRIWFGLLKLRKLIKIADIIHAHDVSFWYLPFRFLYPSKPIFTTFHGYETKYPPSKKAIFVRKVSEKLSWGNICVGDYIGMWYGTSSNHVTYGGIDVHLGGAEVAASSPSEVLKILFVGRLEEDTGILIYLKALELMTQKKIEFQFEACGDGSLRGNAEKYGKVYGFVEDLDGYINKAGIIFASSYLSMMQAMINKRLVFAVYDNSLKEDYLKMSPFAKWIIIENSPEKLVRKIKYFIGHLEDRMRLVNKAHKWVKDQTWDNVVKLYVKLWK